MKKQGFIFIETIIVICVLTIALMSLYNNYSKIISNTRELNTFDITEYNYKTFFLKETYDGNRGDFYKVKVASGSGYDFSFSNSSLIQNSCIELSTTLPTYTNADSPENATEKITDVKKVCLLKDVSTHLDDLTNPTIYTNLDAYIIDYLINQDLNEKNDNLFLVEFKKTDKQNVEENLTYISSLTY